MEKTPKNLHLMGKNTPSFYIPLHIALYIASLAILSVLHIPYDELYEDSIQQDADSRITLAKA